jgi:hypothetical protein
LYELSDERSANQLCELARCYADTGDETFRLRLYEIVKRKPIADSHWLGEEEIIRLDGEKAFLFAARVRGEGLADRAWDWDDDALVGEAIERFGEARVNDLLDDTKNPALQFYWKSWQCQKQAKAEQEPGISRREEMRAITVGKIILAAESNDTQFGLFRGWGLYADDSELAMVFQHLSAAQEANVIANLLRVFSMRAAPEFVVRLVELGQHGDCQVRRWAHIALEKIEHPLVREYVLSQLEDGVRDGSVAGLFIRNYQGGDEHRILEAIELPDDDWDRHGLLMDVIKVLENNPDADCSQLGIIAYASTPCENCRFRAARLLIDQRVAPEWLIDECRFDSSEECRDLVADFSRPPQAESE